MVDEAPPHWHAWNAIADITGVGPSTKVLDVGCGNGAFCELAAGRGAVVHGVDRAIDLIATARRRVPAGDFRAAPMEQLPWPAGSFDVVTGFNAFQYALEVQTALTEACRVVRSGGQVAVCKYGRPKENEFFAFLSALDANGLRLEELPATDAVDRAIERLQLRVAASGEVPAVMSLPSGEALLGALASAGVLADSAGDQSLQTRVATAAAPYRQPDGSYRFENCLKYRIIANTRR